MSWWGWALCVVGVLVAMFTFVCVFAESIGKAAAVISPPKPYQPTVLKPEESRKIQEARRQYLQARRALKKSKEDRKRKR